MYMQYIFFNTLSVLGSYMFDLIIPDYVPEVYWRIMVVMSLIDFFFQLSFSRIHVTCKIELIIKIRTQIQFA